MSIHHQHNDVDDSDSWDNFIDLKKPGSLARPAAPVQSSVTAKPETAVFVKAEVSAPPAAAASKAAPQEVVAVAVVDPPKAAKENHAAQPVAAPPGKKSSAPATVGPVCPFCSVTVVDGKACSGCGAFVVEDTTKKGKKKGKAKKQ
jgi:hypothetical protein